MGENERQKAENDLLEYFRKGFVPEEEREYKERLKRTEEEMFSNERRGERKKETW